MPAPIPPNNINNNCNSSIVHAHTDTHSMGRPLSLCPCVSAALLQGCNNSLMQLLPHLAYCSRLLLQESACRSQSPQQALCWVVATNQQAARHCCSRGKKRIHAWVLLQPGASQPAGGQLFSCVYSTACCSSCKSRHTATTRSSSTSPLSFSLLHHGPG